MTVPQEPVYVVGPRGPKGDPGDGAGLTQEQVEAIVAAAIAALPPSGLTQAQVVTIVNSALSGLPPAGLTAGQVTTLLSAALETALAPYETTAAMSTAITTALTAALEQRTRRMGIVATMPRLPGQPGPVKYGEGPGVQNPVAVVKIGSEAYLVGGAAYSSFGATLVGSNGHVPYITPYDLDTDTFGAAVHIPIPEGAPTRPQPLDEIDVQRDPSGRGMYRVYAITATASPELTESPVMPQLAGHDVWIVDYYAYPVMDDAGLFLQQPLLPYSGKTDAGKNVVVSSGAAGTGLAAQYVQVVVDLGMDATSSVTWEDWEAWMASLTPIQAAVVEAGNTSRRLPGNVAPFPHNEPTPVGDRVGWCLGGGSEAFEVDGKIMFGGGITNLYQPPLVPSGVSAVDQPENHPWVQAPDSPILGKHVYHRLLGKISVEREMFLMMVGDVAGPGDRVQFTLFNINPDLTFTLDYSQPPGAAFWEYVWLPTADIRDIVPPWIGGTGDYWVVVTVNTNGPMPTGTLDVQGPAGDHYQTPEWATTNGRKWMIYDPADESFTTCPTAPVGFPQGLVGGAEGKAFIIALHEATVEMMVYDLAASTWTLTDITEDWAAAGAGGGGIGVVMGRELVFPAAGVQVNLDTHAVTAGLNLALPPEGMTFNYFYVTSLLAVPGGFKVSAAGYDANWNYIPSIIRTYHLDTQTWTNELPDLVPYGDPIGGLYLDTDQTVFNSEGEARSFSGWAVLGMTDAPDPVLRRPSKDGAIPFGTDDTAVNSVGLAYRNGRFRLAVDEGGWITPEDDFTGVLAYMADLAVWQDAITKWTDLGYGPEAGGGLLWLPRGAVGSMPSTDVPGYVVRLDPDPDSPYYGLARFMAPPKALGDIHVVHATADNGDFRFPGGPNATYLIDPQGHWVNLGFWAVGPGADGDLLVVSNIGGTSSMGINSPYQPLHGGPSDGLIHPGQTIWVLSRDQHYYCISKS